MEIFGLMIPYDPSFGGFIVAIVAILFLALMVINKKSGFALLFVQGYELMLDFFSDILGEDEQTWIKSFITNMFFVVLLYNLFGLVFDFIAPIFGGFDAESGDFGTFALSERVTFATSEYHFNIMMAIVGVVISLGVQLVTMDGKTFLGKKLSDSKWQLPFFKFFNFIYEYVPFWGKNIITIERGNLSRFVYYPAWVGIKLFDIIISLFVGFLDIVGLFAKVISLAFRLFGNMVAGTALITVMILGLSGFTANVINIDFPLLAPIVLVAQGLLVASVQAFVFPLLIAIFIKVARMDAMGGEEATT